MDSPDPRTEIDDTQRNSKNTQLARSTRRERKDWNYIRSIPDEKFKACLLEDPLMRERYKHVLTQDHCTILNRQEGAYHLAVCIGFRLKGITDRYIIRVPAHGTAELWKEEDKYIMSRHAEIIRQIRRNTTVPVPKVLSYYTECDDNLGAPWMLMEMLPGKNAYELWFDKPYNESAWLTADIPAAETHRKRVTFLISLAGYMYQLLRLEFDRIGIPKISFSHDINDDEQREEHKAEIGPSYHWENFKVQPRGPFDTTQDYIRPGIDAYFDAGDMAGEDEGSETDEGRNMLLGARKVLEIVFSCEAFNPGRNTEMFVIHHNDLDLQNILTDEEGHVTGIIDWDGAYVGPRCIGPTAAPKFLIRDWYPTEHGTHLQRLPHMGFMLEYYRCIYSAGMYLAELKQGTSTDAKYASTDAKYTSKSALYQAAFGALYEGGHPLDLTDKILRRIPGLGMHPYSFKVMLGRGWPAAEDYLRREIPKILEPELPDEKFMKELTVSPAGAETEWKNLMVLALNHHGDEDMVQISIPLAAIMKAAQPLTEKTKQPFTGSVCITAGPQYSQPFLHDEIHG